MTEDDLALAALCALHLSYHGITDPHTQLQRLATLARPGEVADLYGIGGALARLEQRVAGLLAMERAQFFLRGQTAQLCLLKTLSERRPGPLAIAARSHMALDEEDAVAHLTAMPIVKLGGANPFTLADIQHLTPRPTVCVVELPLRRAAYQLPMLPALQQLSSWCRSNDVHLHIDGARLWEAAAGYAISPSSLAALADSVYVSFYKGLGGLAGAALVGSNELLTAIAPWRTRLGGEAYSAYPYALAASDGLTQRLHRMTAYVERTRALATYLRLAGLTVIPDIPHVNAFQLMLPYAPDDMTARHRTFARQHGVWLFNAFFPHEDPGSSIAEIVIGDAADAHDDIQVLAWIKALLATAPDQPPP